MRCACSETIARTSRVNSIDYTNVASFNRNINLCNWNAIEKTKLRIEHGFGIDTGTIIFLSIHIVVERPAVGTTFGTIFLKKSTASEGCA